MANSVCRRLTIDDLDAFLLAVENKQPLFSNRNSAFTTHPSTPTRESLTNKLLSTAQVWGIFDGDQIIASLTVYPWTQLPYYSMAEFFIIKSRPIPFYEAAGLLFQHAIESMERSGRLTFYVVTRLRSFQVSEIKNEQRLRKITRSIPAFSRYDVYVENIIPPNQMAEFHTYNSLLQNNVWNCHVLIRKCVLKEKHRCEYFANLLQETSS
jgi:hypothetical protein